MSHRLGRVVSDLSHSNSRGAAGHQGLHHQSTTTASNNHDRGNAGRARQRLALLFSGVVAWTRSESSGETGSSSSSREKNKKQQQTANGGGAGARRRGLDIVLALRKYVSMVEQLFASYSGGGGSARRDGDGRDARRRRPHTFTYARGGGGASSSSSRRHKQGRQSSAPASLRGSPANSGHLAVGESMARKASTPSEVSTMEELHSAIQAAIAHCKQSSAGGEQPPPPRA